MKQEINTLKVPAASGRHASISRRKVLLSGGGMLAAAAVLKRVDTRAADSGGDTPREQHRWRRQKRDDYS
jgi:hypothetical protein